MKALDCAYMTRRQMNQNLFGDTIEARTPNSSRAISAKYLLLAAESDEVVAKRIFDEMAPILRRFVDARLRGKGVQVREAEDITPEVLKEIWRNRTKIKAQIDAEWWGFVQTVADHHCSKHFKKKKPPEESINGRVECSALRVDSLPKLLDKALNGQILEVADRLWLHSGGDSTAQTYELSLYIAQQFYFESRHPSELIKILSPIHFRSENEFQNWLCQTANLSEAIFKYLYFSPSQLCCHLLDIDHLAELRTIVQGIVDEEKRHEKIEASNRSARSLLVVNRFFFTEPLSRVYSRYGPELGKERFDEEYAKIQADLPFAERASRVYQYAVRANLVSAIDFMGICKRLAIQYHAIDYIEPKQIFELIVDVGDIFDCRITEQMLSNWLSRGRLYGELEKHLGEAE
ncbi:MAG: hypothetical protein KF784_15550 [Fimbriimonadaceae bacterium]|nr:hypothetical protein [Fimbriimonadaceae bacterium]